MRLNAISLHTPGELGLGKHQEPQQMRTAVLAWLEGCAPEHAIATTQTFDPRRGKAWRDEFRARATFRRFLAKLNRHVYGSAYWRYGKRLRVIPVLEGGIATNEHLHYHTLIELPRHMGEEEFKELAQKLWAHLPETGRDQNTWVRYWSRGWISYMLKSRSKESLLDALDVDNLWLSSRS